MSKHEFVSLSSMRRQCGTCDQWQGKRQIELAEDNQEADCRCRQTWRRVPRWCLAKFQHLATPDLRSAPSLGKPCWTNLRTPVVLSAISQLHREIRMCSHLAGPLPKEMREKLDELLLVIESWYMRRYLASCNEEEHDQEWFFNEFVSGVFDCFYYFGWSHRKPFSSMTLDDVWPLTEPA